MNTHTPGPWVVESLPDEGPSIHTGGAGIARRIAGVDVGGWKRTTLAEAEANARLIAAAPALLAALQGLSARHRDGSSESAWAEWDTAREALAKAGGVP